MNPGQYTSEYFADYEAKGRFLKREQGQRWHQFGYWSRYISRHYSQGSRILEVGCGLGYFAGAVSEKFKYVGTDVAIFPLKVARVREGAQNFIESDAVNLAFHSGSFDVVIAFDMLEHIANPSSVISEIYRVLREKGQLIATTPNVRSFGNRVKSLSADLVPSMHTDETHVSLLSVEEWSNLFKKSGFRIARSASDTLWDIPYSSKIPVVLQKIVLIPFNIGVSYFFGGLPWTLGENLVFVCEK